MGEEWLFAHSLFPFGGPPGYSTLSPKLGGFASPAIRESEQSRRDKTEGSSNQSGISPTNHPNPRHLQLTTEQPQKRTGVIPPPGPRGINCPRQAARHLTLLLVAAEERREGTGEEPIVGLFGNLLFSLFFFLLSQTQPPERVGPGGISLCALVRLLQRKCGR